ncbi:Predicted DNA-binding transcriptional regulator YafY, contains an HTH and WYL domains [Petrocella atlantisensis]|uniref:Predicted DNA-binding transcriptional regulator YafY, contains an HTH and WYL domains n=1 Tax=Petrocella atlantisensis TaxID=2173034 RepID=A0A3P7NWG8_9FIRM|nr:WYL domain-containing transcriptional regulator [Petrocella atlantisensis]VDN47265.1 Predicted DNA-binding transcriptional regulator YafY, contains an HTH and WYL domains [Petrocella atlantisensis]
MANNQNSKLKLLYLYRILNELSDEQNPLTVNDLIEELSKYDISAERKSVYTDIELLQNYGVDVVCEKKRANQYFIGKRDFELPELKLLVDAVQASKFITHKKSDVLIKKIEKLTNAHEAKELHRQVIVNDRIKTMNESIYYNVDAIHSAIRNKKKVQFRYFDYTVDKNLKFRRNGEVYQVSPYALSWTDEYYYLIAYHERYETVTQFRVDRMADIEVSEVNIPENQVDKDFNVADYSKKVFRMFSGETQLIELQFDNSLINVAIDRFGKEISIREKTETSFRITVDVAPSPTFFGWLCMFGSKVKIIGPEKVVGDFKDTVSEIIENY